MEVNEGERFQQKCYNTQADSVMLQNYLEYLLEKDNFKALPRFIAIWRTYHLHFRVGILIYSTVLYPWDLIVNTLLQQASCRSIGKIEKLYGMEYSDGVFSD